MEPTCQKSSRHFFQEVALVDAGKCPHPSASFRAFPRNAQAAAQRLRGSRAEMSNGATSFNKILRRQIHSHHKRIP